MNFFAWQKDPGGKLVPVTFDERPIPGKRSDWRDVIPGTVKEIPLEMRNLSLAELAELMA